jgi:hypothetical protein
MQNIGITAGSGERMCAIATVTVFIVDSSAIIQERLGAMLADLDGVSVVGRAENAASEFDQIPGVLRRLLAGQVTLGDGDR